ncbi:MAG: phenylalanine--tRNA ligase beta subunit-related protein [Sporomusaceae bacterium]|nr:phenylalanine--tRNA ligase beta subunit-related protein [Sporomusaceae bacterium]
MKLQKLIIDESITRKVPGCRLGCMHFEQVSVRGSTPALTQEFIKLQQEASDAYQLDLLPKLPRILAVRSMYKKMAFDPSRYRPASEALIRRVLQNKGVYYVNSAVDVNNYCSIKFLLPFGLYDAAAIEGDVCYRLADTGSYVNISGNTIDAAGKPFLTDNQGVFGNPTSDSLRTAVKLSSTSLLSVIYADEEVTDSALNSMMDVMADMMVRHNSGRVVLRQIVRAEN